MSKQEALAKEKETNTRNKDLSKRRALEGELSLIFAVKQELMKGSMQTVPHPGIKCHLLACFGDDKLPMATALHLQLLLTAALVQSVQHLHTGNHGNTSEL